MEPSQKADVFMRIFNADGSEVGACGNATRCIALLAAEETGRNEVSVETSSGLLKANVNGADRITIDMGKPRFAWDEIPLAEPFHDTTGIELQIGPIDAPVLHSPSVVNVGNPHAIFWVDDVEAYDLARFGPLLENHPIFPERANISWPRISRSGLRARSARPAKDLDGGAAGEGDPRVPSGRQIAERPCQSRGAGRHQLDRGATSARAPRSSSDLTNISDWSAGRVTRITRSRSVPLDATETVMALGPRPGSPRRLPRSVPARPAPPPPRRPCPAPEPG